MTKSDMPDLRSILFSNVVTATNSLLEAVTVPYKPLSTPVGEETPIMIVYVQYLLLA